MTSDHFQNEHPAAFDGDHSTADAIEANSASDQSAQDTHHEHTLADLKSAEADYITFARSGDAAALDRSLRACANHAYTQAYRRLGNAADADDAVQEAFLQLVRSAQRYDGSIPFQVWLALMVKGACLCLLRSDRRRRAREGKAMTRTESHPEPESDHQLAEAVRTKVALLSRADATVIELHYFAGLSQAEVATAVGASENAVTLRLSRARNKLRTLLGGKITAAAVASLLGAQQVYAAPPQIMTGIASLSKTVALGHALPTHVIPLTVTQKAIQFMSLHPISTCACAALLIAGGLIPVFTPSAETPPPATTTKTAPETTTPPGGEKPWQGKAKELLPFIDPEASFQMAIDWQHLRQLAPNTKLTSVFSDERTQKSLAHIAKQFEFFAQNDRDMPDFFKLITNADGVVIALTNETGQNALGFYSSLNEASAEAMVRLAKYENRATQEAQPQKMGPYATLQYDRNLVVAQGGRQFFLSTPERIQAGLTRKVETPPTAPVHVQIDGKKAITILGKLTDKYGDLFDLDAVLGSNWRQSHPTISVNGTAEDGIWRTRTNLRGNLQLPLRPASPDIAGCVTQGNLASLIVGCELKQTLAWAKLGIGESEIKQLLNALNLDEATLLQCLTGDIACMVRQGPVFPEGTIVLGLHKQTSEVLAKKISPFLKQVGLNAVGNDGTAWEGFSPIAKVLVQFSKNRLVIHVSNDELKLATEKPTATDALAIDIDLQSVSRSYLPMLMNLTPTPAQTLYFEGPLQGMLDEIINVVGSLPFDSQKDKKVRTKNLDAIKSDSPRSIHAYWQQLTGDKRLLIEPHIAVFAPEENFRNTDHIRTCQFVFRTPSGWRIISKEDWRNMSSRDVTDLATVKESLKGMGQICGVSIDKLAVFDLPEQASFDRRWLPPLTAILDHMPAYQLRVQKTADGYAAVEDGLPLGMLTGAFASMTFAATSEVKPKDKIYVDRRREASDLQVAFMKAAAAKHATEMENKYKESIEAILKVRDGLAKRNRKDPILLTPSAAFAATGVPLTALASFFNNVAPTSAQVDALGFWHPDDSTHQHFEWLVPIEKDLFIEFAWWARGQYKGAQIAAVPRIEQTPLSPKELAKFTAINEDREARKQRQKPRKPQEKPKPDEANSF